MHRGRGNTFVANGLLHKEMQKYFLRGNVFEAMYFKTFR